MVGRALYMKNAHARWSRCLVPLNAILEFRQFSLQGLEYIKGEFCLIALAWNLMRMLCWQGNLEMRAKSEL